MYRLVVESLLGIRLEVDRLRIEPLVPPSWEEFKIHYRYRNTFYHIRVTSPGGGGRRVRRVLCDGVEQADRAVLLYDDGGEHQVTVEMEPASD